LQKTLNTTSGPAIAPNAHPFYPVHPVHPCESPQILCIVTPIHPMHAIRCRPGFVAKKVRVRV
jgi:hypothetical protein